MAQIASPSTFTCPDCQGALWQLHDGTLRRYRCHTGHAYTARMLERAQRAVVETTLWAALRALQEQERLLRELHASATLEESPGDAHPARAERAHQQASVLREMLIAAPDDTGGA